MARSRYRRRRGRYRKRSRVSNKRYKYKKAPRYRRKFSRRSRRKGKTTLSTGKSVAPRALPDRINAVLKAKCPSASMLTCYDVGTPFSLVDGNPAAGTMVRVDVSPTLYVSPAETTIAEYYDMSTAPPSLDHPMQCIIPFTHLMADKYGEYRPCALKVTFDLRAADDPSIGYAAPMQFNAFYFQTNEARRNNYWNGQDTWFSPPVDTSNMEQLSNCRFVKLRGYGSKPYARLTVFLSIRKLYGMSKSEYSALPTVPWGSNFGTAGQIVLFGVDYNTGPKRLYNCDVSCKYYVQLCGRKLNFL